MIYEIESEEDYQEALHRFLELAGSQKNDEEMNELNFLMALMEKYERNNCSTN